MQTKTKKLLNTYKSKSIYFKSSSSLLLILLCIFTCEYQVFSFSSSNEGSRNVGINPADNNKTSISNIPKTATAIKEEIKYTNDSKDVSKNISFASNVKINHISENITFNEGLTVVEYQNFIRNMLKKKYPDLNAKSMDSRYFFKALAENTYSLNGCLLAKTFNKIVDNRASYLKINGYINTLKIHPDIKKSLKELYIVAYIYLHKIESSRSLEALKYIPANGILYKITDHPVTDYPLGEYVGGKRGENLYYICASFYDNFTKLPKKSQQKVLDKIYSFNPTLMIAEPIVENYNLYHWILNAIFPLEKPRLLKYCIRPNIGWLILPKTIDTS